MAGTTARITWLHDLDEALEEAGRRDMHVLLDFSAAPLRTGCARLDAEVYPDPRVSEIIGTHFVPVRVDVKEQPEQFQELGQRFNAQWTPIALIIDHSGNEKHRIEGFLPADDFLAQLRLGLAHSKFSRGLFTEAAQQFSAVVDNHPQTEAAPEALYWAGVSRYKAMNDPTALSATAEELRTRYSDTSWAKKASVWGN